MGDETSKEAQPDDGGQRDKTPQQDHDGMQGADSLSEPDTLPQVDENDEKNRKKKKKKKKHKKNKKKESKETESGGRRRHSSRAKSLLEIEEEAKREAIEEELKNDQIKWLKHLDLFNFLSDHDLALLAAQMQHEPFLAANQIVTEGESGYKCYFIESGHVRVLKMNEQGQQVLVGKCSGFNNKTGQSALHWFGEPALMKEGKRAATVESVGTVETYSLNRDDMLEAIPDFWERYHENRKRAAVHAGINRIQLANVKKQRRACQNLSECDLEEQRAVKVSIKENLLFKYLTKHQRDAIILKMVIRKFRLGSWLITEGDTLDKWFYVVKSGSLQCFGGGLMDDEGNQSEKTHYCDYGAGDCFGELAIMFDGPRNASIVAMTDCQVYAIDRYTFRSTLQKVVDQRFLTYTRFMESAKVLSFLTHSQILQLAETLTEERLGPEQLAIREGDVGDCMYIVYKGQLEYRNSNMTPNEKGHIYHPGSYFGEKALQNPEKTRSGSIIAKTESVLLRLSEMDFRLIMGTSGIRKMTAQFKNKSSNQEVQRREKKIKEYHPRAMTDWVSKDVLKEVGVLGSGTFGHVRLFRDTSSVGHRKRMYAIKYVGVKETIDKGRIMTVWNERDNLLLLDDPRICKLFCTGNQNAEQYVTFVMEPHLGGTLLQRIHEEYGLSEEAARFYTGHLVLALTHMHKRHVVWRDVKPENILIAQDGNIKCCDFGFSKRLHPGERTFTMCGTPEYIAPEVIKGTGHGAGVDWWALGVLIYEMMCAKPPFHSQNQIEIYRKILNSRKALKFPVGFKEPCRSLIEMLLAPKPSRRLGVVLKGANVLKQHPWLTAADWKWDSLKSFKVNPPWVPDLQDDEDMKYFEKHLAKVCPDPDQLPVFFPTHTGELGT